MPKWGVRTIFGFVLVWFAIGIAMTNVEEPYPTLILPGFTAPGPEDPSRFSQTDIKVKCLFEDGSYEVISPEKLFDDAPRSMVVGLARWFRPVADGRGDEPQITQNALLEALLPGLRARRDKFYEDRAADSMETWLEERMETLAADHTVERIEFVFETVTFEVTASGLNKDRMVSTRRVVEFEP